MENYFFEVSEATINFWKNKNIDFLESIVSGKNIKNKSNTRGEYNESKINRTYKLNQINLLEHFKLNCNDFNFITPSLHQG